jgi:hypothetical protein
MPRRKAKSGAGLGPLNWFLLILLVIQGLWLGLFIRSTGLWLPLGREDALLRSPDWNEAKQDKFEELTIQKILLEKGSKSDPAKKKLD